MSKEKKYYYIQTSDNFSGCLLTELAYKKLRLMMSTGDFGTHIAGCLTWSQVDFLKLKTSVLLYQWNRSKYDFQCLNADLLDITFELISYGVVGNNREGYEVNDAHTTGIEITLPSGFTDVQLIKALKEVGYINSRCRFKSFEIEGENEFSLYITYHTQKRSRYPVCELRNKNNK